VRIINLKCWVALLHKLAPCGELVYTTAGAKRATPRNR
jgi:hypothetical protein